MDHIDAAVVAAATAAFGRRLKRPRDGGVTEAHVFLAGPAPPHSPRTDRRGSAATDETIAHNYRTVQADSVAMGLVNAAGSFLPVLLVRLGATGTQVGLLSALPGVSGVLLAIPIGRWLQRQRNIVSWYSRSRLVAQSA